MASPEEEARKLLAVERHLENAASAVRLARKLAGEGMLAGLLDEILHHLDEAYQIVQRAKQIMLWQWRSADAQGRAA